jgi:predicted HTH transcriptional regulator
MIRIPLQTTADLDQLRESFELECKLAAGRDGKGELPHDFWRSYSAMANTNGGVILLGVKEKDHKFTFNSIEKPEKVLKELFDTANNPGKVSVNLLTNDSAQTLVIEGHTIIVVDIPRAPRRQRPVYLNGNPLGGQCYRRLHEGDQHISDDDVKLMLAEQQHDSLDDELLPTYGMEDLDQGTLKIYRQTHTNLNPGHLWSGHDDVEFLKAIGGWKRNRENGQEGLTKAGLLMFGQYRSIREVFPNFFLDYMERPEAKSDNRWIDRVTFDGTWAGNLYSFYLKVYPKLTADLKVPFQVVDGLRQSDSPVHVALREALANTLVHADYRDRAKIYVVKRPDMFGFLNPGLMRIPIETAIEGYVTDCRNRTLHEMFRYVNIGEQAGTGVQKIVAGWASRHWRKPLIREELEPNNRTILELHMLDLFDPGILDILRLHYRDRFAALDKNAQLALAITLSEGRLTHARLCELSNAHPSDMSKVLRSLVDKEFLSLTGSGRGAIYRFSQVPAMNPDDVFGSGSSTIIDPSSTIIDPSSTISAGSSTISAGSSTISVPADSQNRDEMGRLVAKQFHLPFVDSIEALVPNFRSHLEMVAADPKEKKRMERDELEEVILRLCEGHFMTIKCLAHILQRREKTLRQDYLAKLCKEQRLKRAFPDTPNHEKQAYTKA